MRISELSRRVGINAETLRAWERRYAVIRPRRTDGNTRLYSAIDEARLRVMQRYIAEGFAVAQAAEMAMAARLKLPRGGADAVAAREAQRSIRALGRALGGFDEASADRILEQLLGAYATTAVLRDVVIPYLHEVGEGWADGRLSVAAEHYASSFLQARLQTMALGWDRGLGPRAVLAAAPGDHHTLGLSCFGVALHRLGWRIVWLGAATPIPMLGEASRATGASLVVVSCSLVGLLHPHAGALRELAAEVPVAIGGHGTEAALGDRCGAAHLVDPIEGAARLTVAGGTAALSAGSERRAGSTQD